MWAEGKRFAAQITDREEGGAAGIQVATIHIKGEYAYGYLKGETGVHRLVRISPYDAAGRRQTSFASVDVLPEIDETIDIVLRDDELKRDVFRSGGPGGQHQNKTESGVRYTHLPTGVAAESRSERSQHKNDANALATAQGQADPPGGGEARGRLRQEVRREGGDQLRQPDPLVRPPALPAGQGPADRLRLDQPRQRARRQPRRVHRVVPPDEAGAGRDEEGVTREALRAMPQPGFQFEEAEHRGVLSGPASG